MGLNSSDNNDVNNTSTSEEENIDIEQNISTEENITENQEEIEEKVLKKLKGYVELSDSVSEKINEESEEGEKINDKKVEIAAFIGNVVSQIDYLLKEGGSEDYIESLNDSKEHISKKLEEIQSGFSEEEKIDTKKAIETGASSKNEFDKISKQDQNMNDDDSFERDF